MLQSNYLQQNQQIHNQAQSGTNPQQMQNAHYINSTAGVQVGGHHSANPGQANQHHHHLQYLQQQQLNSQGHNGNPENNPTLKLQ